MGDNGNGKSNDQPRVAPPMSFRTLNVAAFEVCGDCGGLFARAHPAVANIELFGEDGKKTGEGLICGGCLPNHPDVVAQKRPLIETASTIPFDPARRRS